MNRRIMIEVIRKTDQTLSLSTDEKRAAVNKFMAKNYLGWEFEGLAVSGGKTLQRWFLPRKIRDEIAL